MRQERDTQARQQRLGLASVTPPPARLLVGLDGGWIPSREQAGGMEGKVGAVATGQIAVGKRGCRRLTPRCYVATLGSPDALGALSFAVTFALGGDTAPEQVVLADGAAWIKTQAALHFLAALCVPDWAHVARAASGDSHRLPRSRPV